MIANLACPADTSTNPVGGNPSGCSATVERKLEVLKLCAKYDLLIIEGALIVRSAVLIYRRSILLPVHRPHPILL